MRSSTHPARAGWRRRAELLATVVFVSKTGVEGAPATPVVRKSHDSPPGVQVAGVTARGARTISPASDQGVVGTCPSGPSARRRVVTWKSPVTSRKRKGPWKSAYHPLVPGCSRSSPAAESTPTRRVMLGHPSAVWSSFQRASEAALVNSSLSAASSSVRGGRARAACAAATCAARTRNAWRCMVTPGWRCGCLPRANAARRGR
jgi:hypothetical protein